MSELLPSTEADAAPKHDCGVQRIFHECECGAVHKLNVGHYAKRALKCGRYVWALRPDWSTKLVIRPWPGDFRTGFLDYERQKEAEAQEV